MSAGLASPANSPSVKVTGSLVDSVAHPVSYTHLRAHETVLVLVCSLLLVKKTATNLIIIR